MKLQKLDPCLEAGKLGLKPHLQLWDEQQSKEMTFIITSDRPGRTDLQPLLCDRLRAPTQHDLQPF